MSILVCIKTTLNIEPGLLREAMELTGIHQKTAVLHAGLKSLVQRAAARRLASLGGSQPGFKVALRSKRARTP